MGKAREFLEIVGDYNVGSKGSFNNPPTKPIRGSVTGLESSIKKLFAKLNIDADVGIDFKKKKFFGKEQDRNSIRIKLKSMTVDEFNSMPELSEFNSLVSSFGTDWGIVGDTIIVGA